MTEKNDKPVMINIAVKRILKAQERVDNNRTEAEFLEKHTPTPEAAKVEETVNNVQKKAPDEHNFTWKEQKFTGKDNTAISGSGDTPVKTVANGIEKFNEGR